jgi:hypothetical protein
MPEIDNTSESPVAASDTQQPAAWARFYPNGSIASVYLDAPRIDAVPLYRDKPALDRSELSALEWFATYGQPAHRSSVVRKLLERLK